jgi:hypothetical protein
MIDNNCCIRDGSSTWPTGEGLRDSPDISGNGNFSMAIDEAPAPERRREIRVVGPPNMLDVRYEDVDVKVRLNDTSLHGLKLLSPIPMARSEPLLRQ